MKEKELRLAVVCYGGVSLAVYMHGVTKEILKLTRASRAFNRTKERNGEGHQQRQAFAEGPEIDTEHVYLNLLSAIGEQVDLRVIADILAGASAGGINSIVLGKALAYNLSIEPLRQVWLGEADVTRLMSDSSRPRPWSKWFLMPLLSLLSGLRVLKVDIDREFRTKLLTFLRSRWFTPPFDGAKLLKVLLRGIGGMQPLEDGPRSLMPVEHRLDLFVSATDFFGYTRAVPINSPPIVYEREHRHLFQFHYIRDAAGAVTSDLSEANLPGLAFAARATSSFPGAFPPARLAELDAVLATEKVNWPGRERFLEQNFVPHLAAGIDPAEVNFVDGSVANNKPFSAAVQSIRGRPADREVDRRIVYIDPDPEGERARREGATPNFFRALSSALSSIPRNEPIYEELSWIEGFNDQVRRRKRALDSARPEIARMVAMIAQEALNAPASVMQIHDWRETANIVAAREAKYAYPVYVRLKLASVADYLEALLSEVGEVDASLRKRGLIRQILVAWMRASDIYAEDISLRTADILRDVRDLPDWIQFLFAFDVDFRRRRLRFVVRGLNRLYGLLNQPEFAGITPAHIDALKRRFYVPLEYLRRYDDAGFLRPQARESLGKCVRDMISAELAGGPERTTPSAVALRAMGDAIACLRNEIDLTHVNNVVDEIFSFILKDHWPPSLRSELLINYVGFALWDVMAFSISDSRDLEEHDEIRVDRISARDARACEEWFPETQVRGVALEHFGAFFSRRYRENDYLLGRLHAVDRLIDIVHDAAAPDLKNRVPQIETLKRQAFLAILDAERPQLAQSVALIEELRKALTDGR